ncbi:acyl-CoA dehydrogenase family protein [Algiphilus aromaticivorans]|uniref:acyl-CoA dehydrogenase family protein n=1 Tax=Algiphilus aromaticivorans TaxID=382454 RepID=UPI0005C13856|nr:acyl-CoA dehydrogenase family protein [Algiphilus aromaticivorans]
MDNELELFRDNVKRFLEAEVAPHYDQWERDEILPREIWRKMGENGLLCVDMPEEYGGAGAPFSFSCAVVEEASRAGFTAIAGNLSVHSDIVAPYILHLGSEEQKQHYLPKMAAGECVGAIAMTEPGAGSDLQGARTRAEADGDGYRISGQKTFITNGQHADVIVTFTKTDPNAGAKGTTLFLVDGDAEGFARGRNLEKIGQHAGDTSELFYQDVRVPASAVLGRVGGGFGHLMDELPRERLILAVGAVAAAEGCLDLTINYVQERKAFGKPLSAQQNTRFEIARMKTDLDVTKAFSEQCKRSFDAGSFDVPTAAMAKYATTEMQCRVADGCLQLFGGYGYMREYPVSRHYVDARVQRIYGGTSEIMKEIIARAVL